MSQNTPSLPSPNAPPAAITNDKVVLRTSPHLLRLPLHCTKMPVWRIFAGIASKLTLTRGVPISNWQGGVERAAMGRGVFDRTAISLVLEIHSKWATLMSVPVLIQTKKRTRTTHQLRCTNSFEPLRSQSPRIQRLPSTAITSHPFVP